MLLILCATYAFSAAGVEIVVGVITCSRVSM